MTERHMVDPTPELPDDTPIEDVRFTTRTRNALAAAGLRTVGQLREASNSTLLSLQDFGPGSVTHLRKTLGLRSRNGVRPVPLGGLWLALSERLSKYMTSSKGL